jgi:hypothetical protein
MTGQKEKLKNMCMTAKFPNVAAKIINRIFKSFYIPCHLGEKRNKKYFNY